MEKKTIAILGMMCAGCSARVEQKLNSLEGIHTASVNLPARTALVEYDSARISLEQMKDELGKIGYDMVIEEDRNVEAIEHRSYISLRNKVIASWLFALLVMAILISRSGYNWLARCSQPDNAHHQPCQSALLRASVLCHSMETTDSR